METRNRYIYQITNLVNGKTYIGQRTLAEGRTFETDTYRGSGKLLWKAYEKYGKESFKRECIIIGFFTKEQINRFEKCMIACQRLCGKAEYNLADGGDTSKFISYNSESYRKHLSESIQKAFAEGRMTGWKKHDTKGMTGKHFSEETKQRLRESHLGEKNSQYGKKRSEETKCKIREARKRHHDELFSKIQEYLSSLEDFKPGTKSFTEIGKRFNVSYMTIKRCYYEKIKTCC